MLGTFETNDYEFYEFEDRERRISFKIGAALDYSIYLVCLY